MPTDPPWIALYIAYALSAAAAGTAVYAVLRDTDTRDILYRLTRTLSRSGVKLDELTTGPGPSGARRDQVGPPDPMRLIAAPPQVITADGSAAVGDWLQHYALPMIGPDGRRVAATWTSVVVEFYRRLEMDTRVISYFHRSDVGKVKQHFAAVMVQVTRQGITQGDLDTLRTVHAGVRDRDGSPITGAIYDRVIGVLVEVLTENGVPGHAINDLARMLAEADIRGALVTEPALFQ